MIPKIPVVKRDVFVPVTPIDLKTVCEHDFRVSRRYG